MYVKNKFGCEVKFFILLYYPMIMDSMQHRNKKGLHNRIDVNSHRKV